MGSERRKVTVVVQESRELADGYRGTMSPETGREGELFRSPLLSEYILVVLHSDEGCVVSGGGPTVASHDPGASGEVGIFCATKSGSKMARTACIQ